MDEIMTAVDFIITTVLYRKQHIDSPELVTHMYSMLRCEL